MRRYSRYASSVDDGILIEEQVHLALLDLGVRVGIPTMLWACTDLGMAPRAGHVQPGEVSLLGGYGDILFASRT